MAIQHALIRIVTQQEGGMMKTDLWIIMTIMAVLVWSSSARAGNLNPPEAPGPTMHTLEDIYQKQVATYDKVAVLASPQTHMMERRVPFPKYA